MLLHRGHECWVDDYVVFEARRNLAIKGPEALTALEAFITQVQISPAHARRRPLEALDWLPEKDRPVLAAAMNLRYRPA